MRICSDPCDVGSMNHNRNVISYVTVSVRLTYLIYHITVLIIFSFFYFLFMVQVNELHGCMGVLIYFP